MVLRRVKTSFENPQSRFKPWQLAVLAVIALVVFGFAPATRLLVQWKWFDSVGMAQVFSATLQTKVYLGLSVGALTAIILGINLSHALRRTHALEGFKLRDPSGTVRMDLGSIAQKFWIGVTLFIAFVMGTGAATLWNKWMLFTHGVPFHKQDPIFGRDLGFFIFQLPAYEAMQNIAFSSVTAALVLTAITYGLRGGIQATASGVRVRQDARTHLSILGAVAFVLLGVNAWLNQYALSYSTLGPVSGASFADVNGKLPAIRAQVAVSMICAVLVGLHAWRPGRKLLLVAFILYFGSEALAVRLYPSLLHRFSVVPNEAQKEAKYIRNNIRATRHAYALDQVVERDLSGEVSLQKEDLQNNRATIENIRLWDHKPLLDTFAQIQEIRTYYEFRSVDNDRYMIDGKLRQTMLSPRELIESSLPNRTWINEKFTFTHGYGITLGPVNSATPEGLPELFVKDIPPTSEVGTPKVTRPAIYFGEHSSDYVFVKTENREFDYPSGSENVYNDYQGKSGVSLAPWLNRIAVAVHINSFKLLLSDDINSESRVLLHRSIRERVSKVAPFLRYDRDPYLVVRDNGHLSWIMDAYTTSEHYPNSEPTQNGINYIRNSVKVVLDAYDGSMDFYLADPADPIIKAWSRTFPELFRPMRSMPTDIKAHLRYPEDIFSLQTTRFAVYHMKKPELLYNREDQWEIPVVRRTEGASRMSPYYTVMKLPGEKEPEYILMLPFTPKRKDNLAAWMVARMDRGNLGKLVVYRFPKDRLVFGPQQIMNRINQEADISRQISLWDQRGSEAILGTLLVIPVEESLIYVCPLYLRSSGGRIPELKRVIMVYENRITMQPTLDGAVQALFGTTGEAEPTSAGTEKTKGGKETEQAGDGAPRAKTGGTTSVAPWVAKANRLYEEAISAQRSGDWATYGERIKALGSLLQEARSDGDTWTKGTGNGTDAAP